MARGKSEKLLTALPADYSADWLERFDKRTKVWRAANDREQALISDAGGDEALSHARRSLIRRAVFLELLAETQEMRFTSGEPLDIGAYTQAFNSMLGAYRILGLERKAKPTESLHDLMYRNDPEPTPDPDDASEDTPADQPESDDSDAPDEIAAAAPSEAAP
ncbi:MAG TPA: hypothetical protein VHW71_18725 [Steroidobacteraceae bacterium]|jgi:hypothetical protein|nr:hypothetical protein [Steroidobacteraceae bacterium]